MHISNFYVVEQKNIKLSQKAFYKKYHLKYCKKLKIFFEII